MAVLAVLRGTIHPDGEPDLDFVSTVEGWILSRAPYMDIAYTCRREDHMRTLAPVGRHGAEGDRYDALA